MNRISKIRLPITPTDQFNETEIAQVHANIKIDLENKLANFIKNPVFSMNYTTTTSINNSNNETLIAGLFTSSSFTC